MKLYSTFSSERASKGQGGNEYINIGLYCGNKDNPKTLTELKATIEKEKDGKEWAMLYQNDKFITCLSLN